jgi:predicted ATP-grasp superfamily ATP-dependent carboligase
LRLKGIPLMNNAPRPPSSIRILLSEGSSLSAREALSALGSCGYVIDVCDPDPFCLGRFSRFVSNVYRSPAVGTDPQGYLSFLLNHLKRVPYDVLLPVQEQAFLFSRVQKQLQPLVGLAIADFPAFARLQSKVSFLEVLDTLSLPHPRTTYVRTSEELEACRAFPYYVKTEYGTASSGVWKVQTSDEQAQLVARLQAMGQLDGEHHLLVQEVVSGPFCMVQAIFDHGRLIAFHCWQRLREGARGSSSAKMSIRQPLVERHVWQLGKYLGWHGCMAIDYLLDPEQATPLYIDANPRLVECMNATLSGLNLAEVLVRLSLGERLPETLSYRSDVRSHMFMMALLGQAEQGGTRQNLLREIWQASLQRGTYRESREELTPFRIDLLSLLPIFILTTQLLISPGRGLATASRAVTRYSLSSQAIQVIQQEME